MVKLGKQTVFILYMGYLMDKRPVEQIDIKEDDALLEIHLADIRKILGITQNQMAEALGVTQPTIAGMEKLGQDIKLSTLKKYTEAVDCKINFDVELPNGEHYVFTI
mgnify:CR=1 FL=1